MFLCVLLWSVVRLSCAAQFCLGLVRFLFRMFFCGWGLWLSGGLCGVSCVGILGVFVFCLGSGVGFCTYVVAAGVGLACGLVVSSGCVTFSILCGFGVLHPSWFVVCFSPLRAVFALALRFAVVLWLLFALFVLSRCSRVVRLVLRPVRLCGRVLCGAFLCFLWALSVASSVVRRLSVFML